RREIAGLLTAWSSRSSSPSGVSSASRSRATSVRGRASRPQSVWRWAPGSHQAGRKLPLSVSGAPGPGPSVFSGGHEETFARSCRRCSRLQEEDPMKRVPRLAALAAAALLVVSAASATAAPASGTESAFQIPVEYRKLPNGLKVVLSRDKTAPVAVVAVYYNIGFRIEPKDRTGFAHLFEHMMFQGSQNPGKMDVINL